MGVVSRRACDHERVASGSREEIGAGVMVSSRKAVGLVSERGVEGVRVGAGERAPIARRVQESNGARGEGGPIVGSAVVVEIEAQSIGGVQSEVCRANLSHGRPVVVVGKTRTQSGSNGRDG